MRAEQRDDFAIEVALSPAFHDCDAMQVVWHGNYLGIRNLVWVLAPWVFVAITFKEWILVLDG